mmetsp:Transcript_20703/g.40994  ORF Transcript_20703/g.40994 Transcript_20703/m.40994 type:complete len:329 (-) Transcript_20703:511-1497(-)
MISSVLVIVVAAVPICSSLCAACQGPGRPQNCCCANRPDRHESQDLELARVREDDTQDSKHHIEPLVTRCLARVDHPPQVLLDLLLQHLSVGQVEGPQPHPCHCHCTQHHPPNRQRRHSVIPEPTWVEHHSSRADRQKEEDDGGNAHSAERAAHDCAVQDRLEHQTPQDAKGCSYTSSKPQQAGRHPNPLQVRCHQCAVIQDSQIDHAVGKGGQKDRMGDIDRASPALFLGCSSSYLFSVLQGGVVGEQTLDGVVLWVGRQQVIHRDNQQPEDDLLSLATTGLHNQPKDSRSYDLGQQVDPPQLRVGRSQGARACTAVAHHHKQPVFL